LNLVEYLKKATDYLERHDIASPRLNAELLLSSMLGISRLDVYTGFERALTEVESREYRELIVKRAAGAPLQYLTGEVGFRTLVLEVTPGVFIPRPETEVLVEKALEVLPNGEMDILDLGCGSGCIALSIARERTGARVTAVDCERTAVELSLRNAERTGLAERTTVLEGDLFEPLDGAARSFDAIISNPPYVPDGAAESMMPEVRDYEPTRALFAGPDGLDVIKRIVAGAPEYLTVGGWLLLEVDESHADKVVELLEPSGDSATPRMEPARDGARWSDIEVCDDLAGRPRVVKARLASGGGGDAPD
jgi:release factor glutamine methyltransferase